DGAVEDDGVAGGRLDDDRGGGGGEGDRGRGRQVVERHVGGDRVAAADHLGDSTAHGGAGGGVEHLGADQELLGALGAAEHDDGAVPLGELVEGGGPAGAERGELVGGAALLGVDQKDIGGGEETGHLVGAGGR